MEKQNADHVIELTPEQVKFLEKLNPSFRERDIESSRPGELLSADTFMVGTLKGLGRDCQEFRVRAMTMERKEPSHARAQEARIAG